MPSWLNESEAKYLKTKLLNNILWEQPNIRVFGKSYLIPRHTAFIGDELISYSYSGIKHIAHKWPIWFIPLLLKIRGYSGREFNGCLVNLYRNGNDSMGWHSDNEKELDEYSCIASLSFGSTRDLIFRKRSTKTHRRNLSLANGDLLIMEPPCQTYWEHSIPKRSRVSSLRINLTFRKYKQI